MPIYFESYNTNQLQSAKVTFKKEFINASNNKVLDVYTSTQSFDTSAVIPHLSLIDIEMLETGSYILKLTMLDNQENELCSTNIPFERSNEVSSGLVTSEIILDPAFQNSIPKDSVAFYLESLIPIARPAEVKNIIATLKTKDGDK